MRIAIFGTGGVGAYFGGRLAQAGQDVTFIARGEHLQALQNQGLKVDSINGDFTVAPAQASDNPAQVGPVDLIIVGVKAWQITAAAETMKPMLGADTVILPLQNGVEAPTRLSAVLGPEQVLGGLCGIMAFIASPGHIRHTAINPFVKLGELDNHRSERVNKIQQLFEQAEGVTVAVPDDIHVAMWQKFLFITATSGMGAITRSPIGIYRSEAGTRELLIEAMQETYNVARAHGIALPADSISKTMKMVDSLPGTGTASMQRDIMSGRRSELEIQNGAVVRLGQEVGVVTPVNNFIYQCLVALEKKARGELEFAS